VEEHYSSVRKLQQSLDQKLRGSIGNINEDSRRLKMATNKATLKSLKGEDKNNKAKNLE
jgi:hypothetical protein